MTFKPSLQITALEQVRSELEEARDDFQEKFDELDEKAQEGSRGERLQEQIAYVDDALTHLEETIDCLGSITP